MNHNLHNLVLPTTPSNNKSAYLAVILILLQTLWSNSLAARSSTRSTVILPIPSLTLTDNTCFSWHGEITYTATPMPSSILLELEQYRWFGYDGHFHVDTNTKHGVWYTPYSMTGTPEEKLQDINNKIFGIKNPPAGMTKSHHVGHVGGCAADEGMRECSGIFVHESRTINRGYEPITFPFGVCSGVPPVGPSCTFDSPTASINLGNGGRGTRVGASDIHVSCTRPVIYRVSVQPGAVDPDSLQIRSLKIEGRFPPYVSPGTQTRETLSVTVEATVSSEGVFSTSRVLRIDIP